MREEKLFTIIEGVKARSDGTIGNFASLLWELDGASCLTDERVLKLQHNTIGKVNPGAVRLTPMQRSQNLAASYAAANAQGVAGVLAARQVSSLEAGQHG